MKTSVKSISINGDYGVIVIPIRQKPGGDLKRRYLKRLLEYGQVIPSEQVNKILLEVLQELETAYTTIRDLNRIACNLIDVSDEVSESYETEIQELHEDIADLQADLAELNAKKESNETFLLGTAHALTESQENAH